MTKDNRLVYLIVGILAIFLLYWYFVSTTINATQDRGFFGDMFGGLNTLFSGLAFAVIAYSIFQQREELALQREELALQRQEMELTRTELAKTAKLNALSILAQTYSDSLTWMKDINKSGPAAIAAVSKLHEEVIRETENLCGVSGSLYDP
jgi:hypothetical protein